jgi:hypothetical protein
MEKVMTEDIVNEICKVCLEALDWSNMFSIFDGFSIFEGEIRGIKDEESGFYPCGEPILVGDLDLSREVERFLSKITWFQDDMGLVFFVENDIIKMYFCHDSWDGFQPELSFTFKKTFDDDLFD